MPSPLTRRNLWDKAHKLSCIEITCTYIHRIQSLKRSKKEINQSFTWGNSKAQIWKEMSISLPNHTKSNPLLLHFWMNQFHVKLYASTSRKTEVEVRWLAAVWRVWRHKVSQKAANDSINAFSLEAIMNPIICQQITHFKKQDFSRMSEFWNEEQMRWILLVWHQQITMFAKSRTAKTAFCKGLILVYLTFTNSLKE